MPDAQNSKAAKNEFMIVLNIPEPANSSIYEVKKSFAERYNIEHAKLSSSHIVLFNFTQSTGFQKQIVDEVKRICNEQHKFEIEFKDYGFFPRHTVYIAIQKNPDYTRLGKELISNLEAKSFLDSKVTTLKKPHVNIVRDLNESRFLKAYSEYSKKKFNEVVTADSITLLIKSSSGDSNYKWDNKYLFPFAGKENRSSEELTLF